LIHGQRIESSQRSAIHASLGFAMSITRFIPLFLALAGVASAQTAAKDQQPVVMAPVAVTAGPLGYLGITFDLDVDVGLFSHVSNATRIKSMVVASVTKNSPAEIAGQLPKDRVLKIDGAAITDYTIGLLKGIREKEKGDTAEFVVMAADSKTERTVDIIVGTRISPKSAP
jgi:S1-C subfamily serine protease